MMAYQNRRRLNIDNWLNINGFYRKVIPHDGSCIFRAVSEQVFHEYVRTECVNFAKQNSQEFRRYTKNDWDNYLINLGSKLVTYGQLEMRIISRLYKRDILLFNSTNFTITNITQYDYKHKIRLCYINEGHYDSVYTTKLTDTAGFCQSLVYKLLYGNVFEITNVEDVARRMLSVSNTECVTTAHISNTHCRMDLQLEIYQKNTHTFHTTPVFPYKVAKALDPNQYRNIDYDVWSQLRKDIRMNTWYLGGEDLKVGTKCLVRIEKALVECYIQKIVGDNQWFQIYLVKQAVFRTVNREDLQPLPNAEPWPTPFWLNRNTRIGRHNNQLERRGKMQHRRNLMSSSAQTALATLEEDEEQQIDVLSPYPMQTLVAETVLVPPMTSVMQSYSGAGTGRERSVLHWQTRQPLQNTTAPTTTAYPALFATPYYYPFIYGYIPQPTTTVPPPSDPMYIPPMSVLANGSDLPYDMNTLRYYFNIGVQHMQSLQWQQMSAPSWSASTPNMAPSPAVSTQVASAWPAATASTWPTPTASTWYNYTPPTTPSIVSQLAPHPHTPPAQATDVKFTLCKALIKETYTVNNNNVVNLSSDTYVENIQLPQRNYAREQTYHGRPQATLVNSWSIRPVSAIASGNTPAIAASNTGATASSNTATIAPFNPSAIPPSNNE